METADTTTAMAPTPTAALRKHPMAELIQHLQAGGNLHLFDDEWTLEYTRQAGEKPQTIAVTNAQVHWLSSAGLIDVVELCGSAVAKLTRIGAYYETGPLNAGYAAAILQVRDNLGSFCKALLAYEGEELTGLSQSLANLLAGFIKRMGALMIEQPTQALQIIIMDALEDAANGLLTVQGDHDAAARLYARTHLSKCAHELLHWHRRGALSEDATIHKVARLMGAEKDCRDAERVITHLCLKAVATCASA